MTSDPEARVHLRRRLIRGVATALAWVGVAAAVASVPAGAADISPPTARTWAEPRIGANHNQVLI